MDSTSLALASHHVGGRAGTRSFPVLSVFEQDIVNVLYEADTTAIDGIHKQTKDMPSRTIVLADCLGKTAEKRPFYIYSNRYLSSLYRLNPEYEDNFCFDPQFGWDEDPDGRSLITTDVIETNALDAVLHREAGNVPLPDILSLDTQGSELEILQGAEETFKTSVLAVMTEVEFVSMYEGQPLFHEVVAHLQARGFELWGLEVFPTEGASKRLPIGMRGVGRPVGGEALFLRRDYALAGFANPILARVKLAFIAFVLGLFDKTFEILSTVSDDDMECIAKLETRTYGYIEFLKIARSLAASYPRVYPVSYSQIFGRSRSAERFGAADPTVDFGEVRAEYFAGADPDNVRAKISMLGSPDAIGLEKLAEQFQLGEQAESLRKRRLAQVGGLRKWLHLGNQG